MAKGFVRRRQAPLAVFTAVFVFGATTAAGAAAPIEENPPPDTAEWPVLPTGTVEGEIVTGDGAVTDRALAAAGQTSATPSPALAGPSVIVVDDDHAQCPGADFTTSAGLELAIQAAPPGARIRVCPGEYSPVTIDKALHVQGPLHSGEATQCQTPVVADPARHAIISGSRPPALVDVEASGVTFEGLVVEDNDLGVGIRTSVGASGYVIRHNVVQRNRNGVDFNTNGVVESWFVFNCVRDNGETGAGGTGVLSSLGVANARVDENYVSGHDCGSIAFTGPESCLALPGGLPPVTGVTISHNDVVDDSRIAVATAVGVSINYNDIRLRFGPGILLSGFGGAVRDVDVSFNRIDGQNAVVTQGIFVTPSGPSVGTDVTVRANKVENLADLPAFARGHGIVIRSRRTEVHENWIENNRGSGIEIRGGVENRLHGNLVVGNGIPFDVADGIRIQRGSILNVVENNHLRGNLVHDCHDGNPNGANTWRHNLGYTENQPGLCVRPPST